MNIISEVFSDKHVFLPVIHTQGEAQALENTKIAIDAGADGVFFINHSINHSYLLTCYDAVREAFPKLWIGLNCLDLGHRAISKIPEGIDGLWVDDADITDKQVGAEATNFDATRTENDWKGLFFGGVAFKGQQTKVINVACAAKNAVSHMDVITTSGPETGLPPSITKIKNMKGAIGQHPLAIASGMNPNNVEEFMPYADVFLVATGISSSFIDLDPAKAKAFGKRLGK